MNQRATIEEMTQEATERLKKLQKNAHYKLHPNVMYDFTQGKVNFSDNGILYWLNERFLEAVKRIETELNIKVYHAIYNNTTIGEMLCCLVVSNSKDKWHMERQSLEEGYPFCYTINLTDETCSEFGDTPMKGLYGGLLRTDIIYK